MQFFAEIGNFVFLTVVIFVNDWLTCSEMMGRWRAAPIVPTRGYGFWIWGAHRVSCVMELHEQIKENIQLLADIGLLPASFIFLRIRGNLRVDV